MSNDYASLDDFKVDSAPQDVDAGKFGTIQVIPMSYGDVEEQFGDTGETTDLDTERIVEMIKKYVRKPDLSAITVEQVREEFHPMSVAHLLQAIIKVNGMDADVNVDSQGRAQVDVVDVD